MAQIQGAGNRDFGPYLHDSITQLLEELLADIHNMNLPFYYILKVLYLVTVKAIWVQSILYDVQEINVRCFELCGMGGLSY